MACTALSEAQECILSLHIVLSTRNNPVSSQTILHRANIVYEVVLVVSQCGLGGSRTATMMGMLDLIGVACARVKTACKRPFENADVRFWTVKTPPGTTLETEYPPKRYCAPAAPEIHHRALSA